MTTTERDRPRRAGWWTVAKGLAFDSVDIAWLAAFRILFGLVMCVSALRFIAYGWIDDFFVTPTFHFKYYGFAWVEPLGRSGMHGLFWALAAIGLLIASGLFFRAAAVAFVIGFGYLQLVDVTNYLNHYYLATLLGALLAISPAHRAWSLDAWRRKRAGSIATGSIAAAWLYLFRFQVGVVYVFAGLAKANGDWLLHAEPLRIWLAARTDTPVIGGLFAYAPLPVLFSWGGFLFDTFIVLFLLGRRTRPFAFGVVIAFHAMTSLLFPIGMFPVIMVLSALVFFSPSWPRAWVSRVRALTRPGEAAPRESDVIEEPLPAAGGSRRRGLLLAALAAYCALQIAMPLRFLAYGGNVRWHEQGMRFSWRVMVREKNGSVTFIVRNSETGRVWHVRPSAYLTGLQEREMSSQPDLIVQLAHHIKDDVERRGHGPVEVRVEALVSLNGRRGALLIDPEVDLAAVSDGIGRATWILPAPTTPPPHIRPI